MIISFVNKKGGTGKTTSTINIGKALSLKGYKVLLMDLDPQGNLSYSLGISTKECILGEALLTENIPNHFVYNSDGMDVVPSNNDLINYEFDFIQQKCSYTVVKDTLETVSANYDYILIDCPPSAGYLTINALIASDAVIVPMQMDVLSLQGLRQILGTVNEIKEDYNSKLHVLGILGVIVDGRRQLTYDILEHVRNDYKVSIFNNFIRQNVRAAEAPSHGVSVIEYAPKCNSAIDYVNVTNELLTIIKK
jgi:chromosome partitioning protein